MTCNIWDAPIKKSEYEFMVKLMFRLFLYIESLLRIQNEGKPSLQFGRNFAKRQFVNFLLWILFVWLVIFSR